MDTVLTLADITHLAMVIAGVWGFYKIVQEIIKAITSRHDKEQKWDEMEDKMTQSLKDERDKICNNYDRRLNEIEKRIEDNHIESEAKIQQIQAELFILTDCMVGVLDGLHQLNCNGKVTEAREKLDAFLNMRAHE